MGSGVSLQPTAEANEVQAKLKHLLTNKKNMDKLFAKIASSGKASGRVNKATDIDQSELLNFFVPRDHVQKDPTFKSFIVPAEVVTTAFRHIVGKGTSSSSGVSRKQFRVLLPTIFLFSELWKVFEICDNSIDDRKIFKGEFIRAFTALNNANTNLPIPSQSTEDPSGTPKRRISGMEVTEMSLERWEGEFDVIDKDKSGFITFEEFCTYVVKHVIDPMEFLDKDALEDEHDADTGDHEHDDVVLSANGEISFISSVPNSSPPAGEISAPDAPVVTAVTVVTVITAVSEPATIAAATMPKALPTEDVAAAVSSDLKTTGSPRTVPKLSPRAPLGKEPTPALI